MEAPKFDLQDPRLWHYRAYCTRVVDGDTIEVVIDRGYNNFQMERLRLAGINTPELRPRKGTEEEREAEKQRALAAKARVEELVAGRELVIRSEKSGNFGRWLATVFLPLDVISRLGRLAEGEDTPMLSLNDLLLEEGHAVEYP